MKKIDWQAAAFSGAAAGVISGLVKLGWENVLPPRTAERNATNPPQRMLEQMGFPKKFTHATYRYSGQDLPWVSYLIHFGFSSTFGALYKIIGEKYPEVKVGQGVPFGLVIWAAFHLGLLPAAGSFIQIRRKIKIRNAVKPAFLIFLFYKKALKSTKN